MTIGKAVSLFRRVLVTTSIFAITIGLLQLSTADAKTQAGKYDTSSIPARKKTTPTYYLAHPLDPEPQVTAQIQPPKPAPRTRTILMEVTAYCPCKICCGRRAQGLTASGKSVRANGGAFVAADTAVLPFNTKIIVPGYNGGKAIPVLDRGGDIIGRRLDVFFRTHADAEAWGRRTLPVTVLLK